MSKKNDVPICSLVHDEINKLRKRLDKLVAKSSEATPSSINSLFSLEIQHASLPAGFCMTTYEGKTEPQDHLDAFKYYMDFFQVSSRAQYRCFTITLTATAKKWF